MKEQTRNTEVQINEEEMGKLPEKEFRIMIVNMIKNLENKNVLIPFLFLFFFWDPYNLNVDTFDMVPEVSETVLNSFHSFYFILLFRSYFHNFIFQLTDLFFYFRYSGIDSF